MMKAILAVFLSLCIIALIILAGPVVKVIQNKYDYAVQKADDATSYKTLKEVEDSCRAMIASYEADKLIFEQYKDSDNEEKQSWAEQAKMRANQTAAQYNEYIRKNSFVWSDNVPDDIDEKLGYVE